MANYTDIQDLDNETRDIVNKIRTVKVKGLTGAEKNKLRDAINSVEGLPNPKFEKVEGLWVVDYQADSEGAHLVGVAYASL